MSSARRGEVQSMAVLAGYPAGQGPLGAGEDETAPQGQLVELVSVDATELAVRAVSSHDDAAAQQRHGAWIETCCRHEHFGGIEVHRASATAQRRIEPEVELPVGAGQTVQEMASRELGDIGQVENPGLISEALGAEV